MLLYRIKHFSLSCDTLQQASHKILMDTKGFWDRLDTTCACVDDLGSHGRYKFSVCIYCSVFPYFICMTRAWFDGLIFLSGAPGRIKFPVAPASSLDWLTFIALEIIFSRGVVC